ncbi:uncharacterized protein LOC115884011 [Sitophilus oryzae]|uniref:Uncharacterized protein LOC115884011 n=1 Tax=Sitophilus oryzae TaxID=7048 RepID=A0A6J2Y3P2_SITOR|nr:uncharacterized protein LOC115884011 [Sitophilus oryzae]
MNLNPLCVLNRHLTSESHPPAIYDFKEIQGDTRFYLCFVEAGGQTAHGIGQSKEEAKEDAVKNILPLFEIDLDTSEELPDIGTLSLEKADSSMSFMNYIGRLTRQACRNKYDYPRYSYRDERDHNSQFEVKCFFNGLVSVGYGYSKRSAKKQAARKMLSKVQENGFKALHSSYPLLVSLHNGCEGHNNSISNAVSENNNLINTISNNKN